MFKLDFSQIERGDRIAVALSGGKDSVALLDALFRSANEKEFSLCVVNVEHGIRGEASKNDSVFCKDLAASYGLPFYPYAVDALSYSEKTGKSVEEAARILRYDCFFDLLSRGVCDKVAVAHHLSDNVETLLFNLFRGSSLSGAKGIPQNPYSGRIIRPLLSVTGEEVALYVHKQALSFVQDDTNFDTNYTRNALRLSVIPRIKEIFPEAEAALSRFAFIAEKDDEYLYSLAEKEICRVGDRFIFDIDLPYPIFSRCVILSLKKLGIKKDYEKIHADSVFSLKDNISGKKIALPKCVVAVREHDKIVIEKANTDNIRPIPFSLGETVFGNYRIVCEKVEPAAVRFGDGLYFDADKLPIGAHFKVKELGDEFIKFNGETVSVKKYLTDLKFAERKKSSTPLIAIGNIVYCVCEKDVSALIKIDKNTKNIIKLSCKEITEED